MSQSKRFTKRPHSFMCTCGLVNLQSPQECRVSHLSGFRSVPTSAPFATDMRARWHFCRAPHKITFYLTVKVALCHWSMDSGEDCEGLDTRVPFGTGPFLMKLYTLTVYILTWKLCRLAWKCNRWLTYVAGVYRSHFFHILNTVHSWMHQRCSHNDWVTLSHLGWKMTGFILLLIRRQCVNYSTVQLHCASAYFIILFGRGGGVTPHQSVSLD